MSFEEKVIFALAAVGLVGFVLLVGSYLYWLTALR